MFIVMGVADKVSLELIIRGLWDKTVKSLHLNALTFIIIHMAVWMLDQRLI